MWVWLRGNDGWGAWEWRAGGCAGSCLRRNDGDGGAGSCLRRNDGWGSAGMTEGVIGVSERAAGGCSVPLTPHLASPLKGGRDELGKRGGSASWVARRGCLWCSALC